MKSDEIHKQSVLSDYFGKKKCKKEKCGAGNAEADMQQLVTCDLCNDSYHWFCTETLKSMPSVEWEFMCTTCIN